MSSRWSKLAAPLFVFFWASGFISAKYGFPYAAPFTFIAVRCALAAAMLLVLCWVLKCAWPKSARGVAHVVVSGLGIQTAYLTGVWYAIYLGVSTGIIAIVVGLQPLLTGVLAGPLLGERVTRARWIGLVLGFAGLAMVAMERSAFDAGGAAIAFAVLAIVGITLGSLYQKRHGAGVDPFAASAIQSVATGLIAFPLAACFETMQIEWSGEFVFALLWSSIGLSVVAYSLYAYLVNRGELSAMSSLIYLNPPVTAVMGWLVFGENLSLPVLLGMGVAAIGVAIVTRSPVTRSPATKPAKTR